MIPIPPTTSEIDAIAASSAVITDVLLQFLVESIAMCVLGGLLGLAIGAGGATLVGHLTGWRTSTPMSAAALAIGFSASVGVFFGFYPARKAAGLDPIQALRYE